MARADGTGMNLELINAAMAYAEVRYDKGWDVIVETFTKDEVWEEFFHNGKVRTWGGATRKMATFVARYNERRDEAHAESGEF